MQRFSDSQVPHSLCSLDQPQNCIRLLPLHYCLAGRGARFFIPQIEQPHTFLDLAPPALRQLISVLLPNQVALS